MSECERLGNIVNGYQRAHGITDEEMAVIIGRTRATYQRRKKEPETYTVEELLRCAKKFHVTLKEMMNGKGLYE